MMARYSRPCVQKRVTAAVVGSSLVKAAGNRAELPIWTLCSGYQPCREGQPAHQDPHGLPTNAKQSLAATLNSVTSHVGLGLRLLDVVEVAVDEVVGQLGDRAFACRVDPAKNNALDSDRKSVV